MLETQAAIVDLCDVLYRTSVPLYTVHRTYVRTVHTRVITVPASAVGFKEQVAAVPEQNALSLPLINVTALPGIRYTTLSEALVTTPKDILTVAASTHVHVVFCALINVKRELHGHVVVTMPAKSDGVSKLISTTCPLLEN